MSTMQRTLFEAPIARTSDPQTSHAAATAIAPKLTGLRAKCLELIQSNPGITGAEIGAVSESLRKRLRELECDGLIEWRGVRRSAGSRCDGRQWFIKG